jgi:hypothetical protein
MASQQEGHSRRPARATAGTFRAGLEITSRSGSVTRSYRLLLPPGRVRVAYTDGRAGYDVRFDAEIGDVTCTCPAFEADGNCKHRDAVLALLEGLAQRLGRGAPSVGIDEAGGRNGQPHGDSRSITHAPPPPRR